MPAFMSRSAAQDRGPARYLPMCASVVAASALLWLPTSAWPGGPPELGTVTIQARQELERQAHRFVTSVIAQPRGASLERWNEPICPLVAGLPRMLDEYIEGHIAEIAGAANAPVAGKPCRANFFVIATYQPDLFLQKLREKAPWVYDTRNGAGGVERFMHSRRPVRVWLNSNLHCRVNGISGGKSADLMILSETGGGGRQVDTTSPYYCSGGDSRLRYASVNAIFSAFIVVDMQRMKRISTRELADYAAMIGLADVRQDADTGGVPTILGLFRQPEDPPQGLTAWDQALLHSLYNTTQSSVLQVSEMQGSVVARLEHQGKPVRSPAWANEIMPQRDTNLVDWYHQAAEQGDSGAQYTLGFMYDTGRNVPQSYTRAAEWYGRAARQGNAASQYDLGILYANGRGVPQDYAKAAQWFSKAAAQRNAGAENSLGFAYANGQGVPRDDAKAVQWFRRAAEQGDADAQYDLAIMYDSGRGVPRDDVTAYMWWAVARTDSSSRDYTHGSSLRRMTASASRMTAQQIAHADREASAWLAAHRVAH